VSSLSHSKSPASSATSRKCILFLLEYAKSPSRIFKFDLKGSQHRIQTHTYAVATCANCMGYYQVIFDTDGHVIDAVMITCLHLSRQTKHSQLTSIFSLLGRAVSTHKQLFNKCHESKLSSFLTHTSAHKSRFWSKVLFTSTRGLTFDCGVRTAASGYGSTCVRPCGPRAVDRNKSAKGFSFI
jgi:hypothetical protein